MALQRLSGTIRKVQMPLAPRRRPGSSPKKEKSGLLPPQEHSRSPFREAAVAGSPDRVAPPVPILVRLAHGGFVDVDPEPRSLRHRQITVDRRQRVLVGAEVQQVVPAGIVVDAEAD